MCFTVLMILPCYNSVTGAYLKGEDKCSLYVLWKEEKVNQAPESQFYEELKEKMYSLVGTSEEHHSAPQSVKVCFYR